MLRNYIKGESFVERVCLICNSIMNQVGDYLICENCKIAIPDEKAIMEKQLQEMDYLRKELQERLHNLYQKKISTPNNLTANEKIELDIWEKHNALFMDLMHYIKSYDASSDVRLGKIYPRIYAYLVIVQKIEDFYLKIGKEEK